MRDQREYDAIVVVTPGDFKRLRSQHRRIVENLPARRVIFIGSEEVGELLEQEKREGVFPGELSERAGFVAENDVLSFDRVHALMNELGGAYREDGTVPRNFTGWYYQQFIKFSWADRCEDEYYLSWDGDTVPCSQFSMFGDNEKPYLDYKREFHEEYFTTMQRALNLFKVIEPSFISEHMLFNCDLVRQLRSRLENNSELAGKEYWEKILHAIRPEKLLDNSFSEFETYGTFVALNAPGAYRLREWHSFRLAGEFFDINTISDRDYKWLSRDFTAISFEKNMSVREDHRNLFDNPRYQEKLSARQMLEAAQMEFKDGYLEKWDIPLVSSDGNERLRYLDKDTWRDYEQLGDRLASENADQAWLCYENAAFLTTEEGERQRLNEKKMLIADNSKTNVRKTCILILSYNQKYLMQKCLESIEVNCDPGTYSLLVFDNASTDGVAKWLEEYAADRDMTLVLSDENLGFAAGCNAAAEYVPEDHDILLLNNDTRVPANALFWLRMGLYGSKNIGAVGGVQNYGTKEQFEDVSFDLPEDYMEYGAHHNTVMEQPFRPQKKLSGFAMLIRYGLFEELGGFDEQFSPGYFEDDDLCMRIKEKGYCLLLCRNSFIYHAGSQSFAKRQDVNELFERNRKRFADKWGFDSYEEDPVETGQIEDGIDVSEIKLIIWDLDNTFWNGVLSEGEVKPVSRNIELVRCSVDKGIMNSICSRNDADRVKAELTSDRFGNIWDHFVFTSIDWTSKGGRIRQLIEDMSLRAENVLFIDDEAFNREEVRQACQGIMSAGPETTDRLFRAVSGLQASDTDHSRLEQYRLLEKKRKSRKSAVSNEQFLRDSDIRVTYCDDCVKYEARIHELLSRANQLNFTKIRPTEAEVRVLLSDDSCKCAVVKLRDNYGDYGVIGFYAINVDKPHRLTHFVFSCRVMGMGVEQYTYQKLNFPPVEVIGETAVKLQRENIVDWINEESEKDPQSADPKEKESAEKEERSSGRILLKGPCDLDGMIPYFSDSNRFDLETNFVDERGIIVAGSNASIHLYEAFHTPVDEIRRTIERTPFLCEADFITYMFKDPYEAVIFSTLTEGHTGVYRDKLNGMQICFGSSSFDLTDPAAWSRYISGEYVNHNVSFNEESLRRFSENFVFEGVIDPAISVRNLKWMRDKLPKETKLILILGSEIEAEENTPEFADHAPNYQVLNRKIYEEFERDDRVFLINVTDFITGQDCFAGCTNHFSRNVYHKMAEACERCL